MWTDKAVLSFISGHFGLWVDENLYLGRSSPCFTFNNCCLSETDDFRIMDLEAWTFSWRRTRGRLHLHSHHRPTSSLIINAYICSFVASSPQVLGVSVFSGFYWLKWSEQSWSQQPPAVEEIRQWMVSWCAHSCGFGCQTAKAELSWTWTKPLSLNGKGYTS